MQGLVDFFRLFCVFMYTRLTTKTQLFLMFCVKMIKYITITDGWKAELT